MNRGFPLVILGVALSAGAVGYFVGWRAGARTHTESSGTDSVTTQAGRGQASRVATAGESASDAAARTAEPWATRWQRLAHTGANSPATEREKAAALTELTATDPRRALALALAEPNLSLRARFRDAVLRGWATHDPDAAAKWALTLHEADRSDAIAAVLAGAVAHAPDAAVQLAARLCAQDGVRAADYGQALIGGLADAGEFQLATRFVAASAATPLRAEQMNTAFQLWAEHRPEEAAAAVDAIADPDLRREAFRGMAVGWAAADPVGLANFAVNLPAGETRAQALANALPRWVEQDPVAAAGWLAQHDTNPDFDLGVVAVANQPALLSDRPEMAMSLAASISDPALRTNTLRTLVLNWAARDAAAARRFVASSSDFPPDERAAILAETAQTP